MKYNKAIRDRIPEIIKESGMDCVVKTLTDDEFLQEMEKKLKEEVDEYLENKTVEELADILEVIHRILELKNINKSELEKIRITKAQKRGAFKNNLYLIETIEY